MAETEKEITAKVHNASLMGGIEIIKGNERVSFKKDTQNTGEPNPRECPLCKMLDEEIGKITNKEHHTSTLKQGEKLLDHLVNFHRLPSKIAGMFATGYALGSFLKDHPTFDVSFGNTGIKLQKED